jgi:putative oxidoreductase
MNKIHAFMHRLDNKDAGILLVRLMIGIVFVHAGWLKLTDMDMVVGGFAMAGIPKFLAYFVSYFEFLGGLALILGIFSRYVGVVLAVIMAVATVLVHFPNGYGMQNGGYEYTLALFLGALALVTFGSGRYSLAGCLKKRKSAQVTM